MSYVRFGSILEIEEPCSDCGRLPWKQYSGDPFERWDACRADMARGLPEDELICHACTSGWYIFRDYTSNRLEIYSADRGFVSTAFDEQTVRDIVAREAWSEIPGFDEQGDQGVLASSLRQYLEDCEGS